MPKLVDFTPANPNFAAKIAINPAEVVFITPGKANPAETVLRLVGRDQAVSVACPYADTLKLLNDAL